MRAIGTIRKFTTPQFSVIVDAVEDPDCDLSFDDTGEIMEGLENGSLQAFAVRARVYFNGSEIGADYIGGCIYRDIAEFEDHRQCAAETRRLRLAGSGAVCGSYFHDMVKTAIAEARTNLRNLQNVRVRV